MKTLICDDHRLFSDALASWLTMQGFNVVGCPTEPAHAVAFVARETVELCLMDVVFGQDSSGIAAISALRKASPSTKVVVLTGTTDPALILHAIEAGADDIAFKGDDLDDVVATIRQVAGGGVVGHRQPGDRSPSVPAAEPRSRHGRGADELGRFLTDREHQVLLLLVRGKSTKQIARHLDVAYSTARTHVQNVLVKLGVHSRLEAVAVAVERGLTGLA